MALLPIRNLTDSDTECFDGIDNIKWIWSICILPSKISMFLHLHNCRIFSRTDLSTSLRIILNRYFEHHTKWYLRCQIRVLASLKLVYEILPFNLWGYH